MTLLFIIISSFLFLLLGVSVYIIINLYIKNKLAESYNDEYENWFNFMTQKLKESYDRMRELDIRGALEADDEVGYAFKSIKEIIDNLNNLINEE